MENYFLEDLAKAFIISIGAKRQGKTYLMVRALAYAIDNNMFEEYHLVFPQFSGERSGAYDFLKGRKNVFIYDKYHEVLTQKILKVFKEKHVFFGIDDASGEFMNNLDTAFCKLATCNEHQKKCTIWLCVHSAKKILSPLIRQQASFIFMYRISNMKLIQDMYEEFFSTEFGHFKEFYEIYNQNVRQYDEVDEKGNKKRNAIVYSLEGKHDFEGITNWELINYEPTPMKGKEKAKPNKVQETPENGNTFNNFRFSKNIRI